MRPTSRRSRLGVALLAVVLSTALALPHDAATATSPAVDDGDGHVWTKHSSDGVTGPIAPRVPFGRFFADREVTSSWRFQVAPGVTFRRWRWRDARGPVRAQLLRADLDHRRVTLDHVAPALVPARTKLSRLVRRRGAIAGVNGDFFDIGDTGAPLGNARGRRTGLRSAAPEDGWTKSFWINPRGVPRIGRPHLEAHVAGKRWLSVDQWNAPTVLRGNIGIYRPAWGRTSGRRVVDGQRKNVREVLVRRGRVRSNRRSLSKGTRIRPGFVLVGRGQGADRLRSLRRGTRVRIRSQLSQRARVLVSGSVILRKEGEDNTIDDRQMHPRTAIGIDTDKNRVLLLVVDGRYAGSRGLTMKETSELMRRLGAEWALNLDGGGSSTMVARNPKRRLRVMNRPSDGRQRPVPNGIAILRR